ncbi:hypothetical protein [Deinococcus rubellus]|uniref:Uncharacterized protein n=1 Tax=Deinococcus rubellus TaxID=1889240 RepID=A0ABY5YCG7_9DEIO|nr:hypothetical protein [Deinococcus rubellus]UWX62750.1 hypothetical protein N0D28_08185 [Deinococcus rubellus]
MTRQNFQPSAKLGVSWPIFILGERGEVEGINMLDALYPASVDEARALYLPIFERVCPAAAVGLALAEDEALTYWVNVLRGPLLTGEHDELTFLPSWCKADGMTLTGLTRLLALHPDQRMDVFMAAMELTGMGL